MDKNLKELMQISIISENTELSNLIKDIIPTKEQRFTNLELEADKKQEFSLVIYKKTNPLISFIRSIKFAFEKIRIMKHSKQFDLAKNQNKY